MISGLSREISFIAITWIPDSNCEQSEEKWIVAESRPMLMNVTSSVATSSSSVNSPISSKSPGILKSIYRKT